MVKTLVFTPRGVCSRQMKVTVDGDVVVGLEVLGGCSGNLQGIAKLVRGMKISEVVERLSGIDCGGKGTSCPDQLARHLAEIKQDQQA